MLLADAEGGEDTVEDVVGGGGSGDGIDWPQGGVEIEQQHLVRDTDFYCGTRGLESLQRVFEAALVAEAGDETVLLFDDAFGGDGFKDALAKLGDSGSGKGGDWMEEFGGMWWLGAWIRVRAYGLALWQLGPRP